MVKTSDIEHFQSITVNYERIAELDGDSARIIQLRSADLGDYFGMQRIIQAHYRQASVTQYVGIDAGDSDASRAIQCSIGIERNGAMNEVVARFAVKQSRDSRNLG